MNVNIVADCMFFFFLGSICLVSCFLIVKRCIKDMKELKNLRMQVVPAIEVDEMEPDAIEVIPVNVLTEHQMT